MRRGMKAFQVRQIACFRRFVRLSCPAMKVLIAGSNGLIGAEAVSHYDSDRHEVYAVENNMRREFFEPPGDSCLVRAAR